MQTRPRAAARPSRRILAAPAAWLVSLLVAACGPAPSLSPITSAAVSAQGSPQASPSAQSTPTPAASALPTPVYTNPPDPGLARLIPKRLDGVDISVPPHDQFAYTPGDFGSAYGELGLRFTALQVAFVESPRLSLYLARVSAPQPTTRSLEPYLATAGQYVGIAGLHREPWRYLRIGGRVAWVRPEDNATVAGTHIYTWAADEYVFLMIGVDDRLNRALFAALPGERAAAATPRPSTSPGPSASP